MNLLVDEGILYKKRGLGMFVTNEAKKIVQEKRRLQFLEDKLPRIIEEAKLLGMTKEDFKNNLEEGWHDTI